MSTQVLHLDFVSLLDTTGPEQRSRLASAAAELGALEQVIGAGLLEAGPGSDFQLVFYFLLPDFLALEPFGTDPAYSRFLQGSVAPVLKGFAGADVRLQDDFVWEDGPAACLALSAPEETYDWEVGEALTAWATSIEARRAAVGLAVGEKQRYRGACLAFGGDSEAAQPPRQWVLAPTLIRGTARRLA